MSLNNRYLWPIATPCQCWRHRGSQPAGTNNVLSLLACRINLALAKATVVPRIEGITPSQIAATHEGGATPYTLSPLFAIPSLAK